jgi:hypothetical protein
MKIRDICYYRYLGSDARTPINRWAKPKGSCSLDRSSRVVPRRVRSGVKLSGFMICFGWTTARATGRTGSDEWQRIALLPPTIGSTRRLSIGRTESQCCARCCGTLNFNGVCRRSGQVQKEVKSNGNRWKCAGGGVLLEGLQRCFHLFISHKHHLLIYRAGDGDRTRDVQLGKLNVGCK